MKKLKKIVQTSCLVLLLASICVSMSICSNGKSQFVNHRPVPGLITSPNLCPIKENHKQDKKCTKEYSKEGTIYGSSLKESNDTLFLKGK